MRDTILPYNSRLKQLAQKLRKESTLSEVLLWRELRGKRILGFDFHRQKPINEYVVDFYCPELKLAIEIDGVTHEYEETFSNDASRQARLESIGVSFLRFQDGDIKKNLEGVVMKISDWIKQNANTPRPSGHPSQEGTTQRIPSVGGGRSGDGCPVDTQEAEGRGGYKLILDNLSNSDDVSITHEDGVLYYVLYGFANMKKKIEIHLAKEGAEANILGILIGREGECSVSTVQHHQAPNTKSDLLVKTILTGDAKFSYDGLIKIDKGAQKSNAYQRNENILLSNKAHVDTKPELEILANDVRCTHGATIGRLDEEMIFYLQSRGLNRKEATDLILRGFAESVLGRIPDDERKREVEEFISEQLDTKFD